MQNSTARYQFYEQVLNKTKIRRVKTKKNVPKILLNLF